MRGHTVEKFNAGDIVNLKTMGGRKVQVEFGPYRGPAGRVADTYVVQFMDGTEAGTGIPVTAANLERGPKFKADDAVVVMPLDTPGTVAAGPFKIRAGESRYVIRYESGTHVWASESVLVARTAPETFTMFGQRWEMNATYRDKDCDDWKFTGEYQDGEPLLGMYGDSEGSTLGHVLRDFGPLTKHN
ncbi:phiSA1p31-related protein [Streptomyces sp. NPDC007025]|uniref:phiSA1p31-related protein n=1 Tax=Streptomyces sp. NPDC007025 TaxID=3364771 RepID=UPI0036C565E9